MEAKSSVQSDEKECGDDLDHCGIRSQLKPEANCSACGCWGTKHGWEVDGRMGRYHDDFHHELPAFDDEGGWPADPRKHEDVA